MPHVIHAAFSLASSVLFFVVALLLVVADHELEPMSRSLLAAPHSMCELRMLLCKTAITIADIVLRPVPHVQVTVYATACILMLWYQIRWVRRAIAGSWCCAPRRAPTGSHKPPPGHGPAYSVFVYVCVRTCVTNAHHAHGRHSAPGQHPMLLLCLHLCSRL